MSNRRSCNLATTALVLLVLALFPALARADRAEPSHPTIYLSTCGEHELVAPRSFGPVCGSPGGLLGTTFPSTPEHVVYRHYGSASAPATGTVRACLLGPVQNLSLCPEGLLPPSEEAETSQHVLPATLRFFDVVSCRRVDAGYYAQSSYDSVFYNSWHLFYGELSYRFAGGSANARSIVPRNEVETHIQPTCRTVKLRKR